MTKPVGSAAKRAAAIFAQAPTPWRRILIGPAGSGKFSACAALAVAVLRKEPAAKILFVAPTYGFGTVAQRLRLRGLTAVQLKDYEFRETVDKGVADSSGIVAIVREDAVSGTIGRFALGLPLSLLIVFDCDALVERFELLSPQNYVGWATKRLLIATQGLFLKAPEMLESQRLVRLPSLSEMLVQPVRALRVYALSDPERELLELIQWDPAIAETAMLPALSSLAALSLALTKMSQDEAGMVQRISSVADQITSDSKIYAVFDEIRERLAQGRRVLLLSQYASSLSYIETEASAVGLSATRVMRGDVIDTKSRFLLAHFSAYFEIAQGDLDDIVLFDVPRRVDGWDQFWATVGRPLERPAVVLHAFLPQDVDLGKTHAMSLGAWGFSVAESRKASAVREP